MTTTTGYQFGDNAAASERLLLLAEVFRGSTLDFLRRVVRFVPQTALDLGSGPGLTTALVREATGARRTVGLESSTRFVLAARARPGKDLEFLEHDVTRTPFPTPRADLIYCRFLLSHIQKPLEAMAAWAHQLNEGGLLLIEELESITSQEPSLARYAAFVQSLLASQGQTLYVGSGISSCRPGGCELVSSDVSLVPVPRQKAAAMFSMNLLQLRESEWARQHYSADWFDGLSRDLEALGMAAGGEPVVWGLRQHALRRT